jgi:YbbR domain-containing protein
MAWVPYRNFGLKLLALVLGTLLWFTVSGHDIERRLAVPVSYSNIPAPLDLTGDQIDSVNVQVRGIENIVSALTPGQLRVIVDLSDGQSGPNIVPLRPEGVVAPLGVEVLQIEPGTATVTLERVGRAKATVHPTIEGTPAPGYSIGEVTVEPATVTVEGPESRLTGSIAVITERVMLEGRTATVVQDVRVGLTDARMRILEPRTVRVTVVIEPDRSGARNGDRRLGRLIGRGP